MVEKKSGCLIQSLMDSFSLVNKDWGLYLRKNLDVAAGAYQPTPDAMRFLPIVLLYGCGVLMT